MCVCVYVPRPSSLEAMVPFEERATFLHRLNGIREAAGVDVVPPSDEHDGSTISVS